MIAENIRIITCLLYLSLGNESYFHIIAQYRQIRFRQTTQVQAYNLDHLIGNIGGYMGLFLGYALVQFPNFFAELLDSAKKMTVDRRSLKTWKSKSI